MNTEFQASVARIIDAGGKTVGTGFVVTSDGLIVTCAHVIDIARSDDSIHLLFHDPSSAKEKREVRVARVEPDYWRDAAAEDVAFVRLEGPLPKGAVPLPLGSSFNTQGQTFRSFGFPEARPDDGMLGECRVIGFVSEDSISLLQLSSNQVSKGFSGAPVWDDSRHVVIGMVTSIVATRRIKIASTELLIPFDSSWRQTETAFATPVETLFKIYPLLQPSEVCPYRGLDAFSEDHAKFFFGREYVIDRLVNRLKQDVRFLAVLGPSGSGKSSVVQAGLVHQLRQGAIPGSDHWGLVVTRPADDPFKQLAAKGFEVESQDLTASVQAWLAQHPGQTRLVLVLDQFEELLTACPEALRQKFVMQLTSLLATSLPITIVLVMRDDFYDQFVRQETLVEWLEQSQGPVNVPQTLRQAEVTAIVQKPAEAVGLRFEDGLIEIIVKDAMEATASTSDEGAVTRSSNLPLLEFALTQLWERRENGMLIRKAYATIGGVTGGLTQWADRVFFGLENEEKQRKAHRIFTDLVHIGDEKQGLPDSRRRMSLDLLCRDEHELEEVHQIVRQLASARLLVTSYDVQSKQEMVEIIHDALLLEWGLLKHWLQEDRNFLIWHQELEKQARAWDESKVNEHERHGISNNLDILHLFRHMAAQEESAKRAVYKLLDGPDLKEAEKCLNERSTDLRPIEQDFILASQAERKRRIRRNVVLSLVGLGIAVGIGGVGEFTWQSHFQEQGKTPPSPHPTPTPFTQNKPLLTYPGHTSPVNVVAWSPDSTRIVSGSDNTPRVLVWNASTGKTLLAYMGNSDEVKAVAWSPNGKRIASGGVDKTVQVWDATTGKPLLTYRGHSLEVRKVAWSPDSRHIASASWDGTVQVWDATTGKNLFTYRGHTVAVWAVAWSPNGKYIASGGADETVLVWDPTGVLNTADNEQDVFAYHGHQDTVFTVAWSPDSTRIASGSRDETVQVWDATSGGNSHTYNAHSSSVYSVAWSPAGKDIVSASLDHTVQVWDVASGNILRIYTGHSNWVNSVAWSPNGKYITSASDDTKVMIWPAP